MRIRSRFLKKLAAAVATTLIKLLFRSCRVEVHADVEEANPYRDTGTGRFLFCIWHDQLLMTIFALQPQNMAGLVSQHEDGSYLADGMQMLGIKPVRGSTKHGGAQAMRQLLETIRDLHVAITPDGPRGPRRKIKLGLIFLASHSGRAIVPVAYTCKRCWKIQGSWTDMMIPKPFTKLIVRGGPLFYVPSELSRKELRHYVEALDAEMQRLEVEAEQILRGEEIAIPERKAAA